MWEFSLKFMDGNRPATSTLQVQELPIQYHSNCERCLIRKQFFMITAVLIITVLKKLNNSKLIDLKKKATFILELRNVGSDMSTIKKPRSGLGKEISLVTSVVKNIRKKWQKIYKTRKKECTKKNE